MKHDERKCGNCWCGRVPNPAYKGGVGMRVCALRPIETDDSTLQPESWCCPEHRTAEEQAATWEARRVWHLAAARMMDHCDGDAPREGGTE